MRLITLLAVGVYLMATIQPAAATERDWHNDFVVQMSWIPSKLDNMEVPSAMDHLVLRHLVRPLIRFNLQAEIEGDLLESWVVEDDSKTFLFKLKDAKFSDGQPILADDVVHSFDRGIKHGSAIHFDFTRILDVRATSPRELKVRLKVRDINFLRMLRHPEFGVLSPLDAKAAPGRQTFKVTAGPYVLDSIGNGSIHMTRNPFYEMATPDAPKKVTFLKVEQGKTWTDGIVSGAADLAPATLDIADHRLIMSTGRMAVFKPQLGFTFWVAINPTSKHTSDLAVRRYIMRLLSSDPITKPEMAPIWTPAREIYLADSIGRTDGQWLDNYWKAIKKEPKPTKMPAKLSLLISAKLGFRDRIVKNLQSGGVDVAVTTYQDQQQFIELTKLHNYDLFQTNMDFSETDVLSSLDVTFRDSRPLIVTGTDRTVQNIIEEVRHLPDVASRQPGYERIAQHLLAQAYVSPIAYFNLCYYYPRTTSVEKWSTLFSDVSLWRLTASPKP